MEAIEKKLDPEFKAKWVAALRSGEYKQGKSVMYNSADDSLCCLAVAGVLCGISKLEMKGVDIFSLTEDFSDEAKHKHELSKRAVNEMGYPELIAASFDTYGTRLAEMNDHGKSFSEIADWIEENL